MYIIYDTKFNDFYNEFTGWNKSFSKATVFTSLSHAKEAVGDYDSNFEVIDYDMALAMLS